MAQSAMIPVLGGYLTAENGNNLRYWLFESRTDKGNAPWAVFQRGGPATGTMGNIVMPFGPCSLNAAGKPTISSPALNDYAYVIYVDQMIGAGLSFGGDPVNKDRIVSIHVWDLRPPQLSTSGSRTYLVRSILRRSLEYTPSHLHDNPE